MLHKSRWQNVWPLLGIVLLALVLRLPHLNGSFWMDEAAQVLESSRPVAEQLQIRDDFQPPLLHLITFLSVRVSQYEAWLRTFGALIPGLVTVVLTYLLGVQLTGQRRVGLAAALLLSTASFHIFYSQELRPYALPAMWASLSWWLLLLWWQRVRNQQRSRWWLFLWLGATTLGLYSSYLYPFLLVSQVVWVGVLQVFAPDTRQEWQGFVKQFGLALLGVVVLFAVWIPSFLGQLQAGQLLRLNLPGWESVVSTPQLKALALVPAKFLYGVVDITANPYFIVYALLFVVTLGIVSFSFVRQVQSARVSIKKVQTLLWPGFVLLTWLLVPLLSAWLISFIVPVLQPKRVLFLLPAWYLLLSWLALAFAFKSKQVLVRVAGVLLLGGVLLINLAGTTAYYLDPQLQRENWRAAHETLTAGLYQVTPKLFVFDAPFASWAWYDRSNPLKSQTTFSLKNSKAATPDLAADLVSRATAEYTIPQVAYFDYLTDLTDPQHLVLSELEAYGYQPTDLLDYPNIGFIRIFVKSSAAYSMRPRSSTIAFYATHWN